MILAVKVFARLGLTPTAAVTLFYIQVIRTKSIPFALIAKTPNEETLKAMKEAEEMEKDPSKTRIFSSVDELMDDLKKDL
jgi:DNA-damage-inducible protein J